MNIPAFLPFPIPMAPAFVQPIPLYYPYPICTDVARPQEVPPGKIVKMIGWCPPPPGWIKVNTDGAYKSSIDSASAGGLVRDSNGNWCTGFSMNLGGSISPLEAEFIGILGGLELVWKLGFRNVILESDCKVVVDFLNNCRETDDHLIQNIYQLLGREWNVKIQHQYREGNQAADSLANLGIQLATGYHEFLHPPICVFDHVMKDCNGARYPRLCWI